MVPRVDLNAICAIVMQMRYAMILAVVAAPAFADCPVVEDNSAALLDLIDRAQSAQNANIGRSVSGEMWRIYLQAPDTAAQTVLDQGMSRQRQGDYLGSIGEFGKLIAYCPDYAEGYNQRAYSHFLRGDYANALPDLDEAVRLNPYHVAALSGRALTLMNLGRLEEARAQMLDAVALNPWLSERALLADGAPLEQKGEDI